MVVYAIKNAMDLEKKDILMTWYKSDKEPLNAEINNTYDLSDERMVHLGNGTKEFFATSAGYGTNGTIFAFVKANNLEDCIEILKKQYPALQGDGSGARYIGIHIRELGVPQFVSKVYDETFYTK